jgi:acetylornithine deacetylase/succinyl-diaminopimelate desuccinylase-like protein
VQPLSDLERAALKAIPGNRDEVMASIGIERLDEPAERDLWERLSAWPTLTINGLHGGYGGPGSKTVLPHEASAKCDIRLVEAQSAEDIFVKVQAHVARHAPAVEVVYGGAMEPSKTPLDSPFVEPIRRAIHTTQGEDPLLLPALGGSLFRRSSFRTPMPTRRTTRRTKTWRSSASPRASRPAPPC